MRTRACRLCEKTDNLKHLEFRCDGMCYDLWVCLECRKPLADFIEGWLAGQHVKPHPTAEEDR